MPRGAEQPHPLALTATFHLFSTPPQLYYLLPGAVMAAGAIAAKVAGVSAAILSNGITLVSCALCIASIGCLSHQSTARTGGWHSALACVFLCMLCGDGSKTAPDLGPSRGHLDFGRPHPLHTTGRIPSKRPPP